MALVLGLLSVSSHAEAPPSRESDLLLPTLTNGIQAIASTPNDPRRSIISGGSVSLLDQNGSIQWSLSAGFLESYSHISAFPDRTTFVSRLRHALLPLPFPPIPFPGLTRAYVVRSEASGPGPTPPTANLSGDDDPTVPFPSVGAIPMGVAVDAVRDRVYTAHQRMALDFSGALFEERIRAFDGALNPVAEWIIPHEFASSAIQLAGVFTDAEGFVWTAGVETPPGPLTPRLIVARLQPSLEGEPLIHRLTLGAQGGTIRAAVDPRGGLILAGERDAAGNSDYFRRVSPDGFSPSFRRQGFAGGPLAVDPEGALYLGGRNPLNNAPSIIKLGLDNGPLWSPAHLELPGDRTIQAIAVLAPDTIDVAGTQDVPFPGSDRAFISRYRPGASGLVAVSDLIQEARVNQELESRLAVEVRDAAGTVQGNIPVDFEITSTPRIGQALISPDQRTDPISGRATAGFRVGNLPLEYEVTAECPSCSGAQNSVVFQICGKLPATLLLQDGQTWSDTKLDDHSKGLTIGERGCALSAYTMLLNIFKAQDNLTYPESTPGTLNEYLTEKAHYGFVPDANLDFFTSTKLFTNNQVAFVRRLDVDLDPANYRASVRRVASHIDASLEQGRPALLQVESGTVAGHFLTVIGRCGSKYLVADPFSGTGYPYIDAEDPNEITILGARIFKRGL